ncbi:MAG: prephenate dehydrogenase [Candidatus Omnitrophota bacterium]
MKIFDKVVIVGTGLIGGSIGLTLKKKKLCRLVVGVSLHKESLAAAKKIGAVDIGSLSLEVVRGADLVILAAPVSAIINLAPKISAFAGKNCLVFDVGSTKAGIVSKLSELFPHFVGTHPLAGSEKRGIKHAQLDLFHNSLCIITPAKNTDRAAVSKVIKLWRILGAKILLMNPAAHDRALGFISHLPHLAAFSLINSIPDEYLKLSPASLKETTRIAASDSGLWADIILDNRVNILKTIEIFQTSLNQIKTAITENNRRKLDGIFLKARKKRESF